MNAAKAEKPVNYYRRRDEVLEELGEFERSAETQWRLADLYAESQNVDLAVESAEYAAHYFSRSQPARANEVRELIVRWRPNPNQSP